MCWIETYTGLQFFPFNPRPEDVRIEDIAHALSMRCRWGGHCKSFYSVAQHCVLLCDLANDRLWGLMHDSAEAYLTDVMKPIKERINDIVIIESKILKVIAGVYGLQLPIPDEIHNLDAQLLATERRDLMPNTQCKSSATPLQERITPWNQRTAKSMFLDRFNYLFGDH